MSHTLCCDIRLAKWPFGYSTLCISAFMPLKNTTAFTCNLIETVVGVMKRWVRKTQTIMNLKAIDCCEIPPNDKLIYFPSDLANCKTVWTV